MRIATWNVNSVRQRLEHLLLLLKEHEPDIVCLQELKCQYDDFPFADLTMAGYHAQVVGQKSYNGVALLSKQPACDVLESLPGDAEDTQARYLEASFTGAGKTGEQKPFRVASLYLPNGNPVGSDKYPYKLQWMDRLKKHTTELLKTEMPVILAGDYNVIPRAEDAAEPESWKNDALYVITTRQKFRELLNLGLSDAVLLGVSDKKAYTFWDYQANCWQRNNGIRIDHILLSPQAMDCMTSVEIIKNMRGLEKPSDHVPVMITLDL